jgi:polygalacturonase
MKNGFLVCAISLVAVSCQSVSTPRQAERKAGIVCDVRAFGAIGDGKTLDTRAINDAIDAAHARGGGTVWIGAGQYRSLSIHLKSNVCIYLDQGATIVAASPSAEAQYDPAEPNQWEDFEDFGHSHFHNSLIWGENLENVSIIGPGMIDGRGLSRGDADKKHLTTVPRTGKFGFPNVRDTLPAGVGNKAISLKNCRNVIIRDITLFRGGHFAILATDVDNLTVDNLKIDTNRDGIDIDCCRNVRVSNCSVNSPQDDGICLKSTFALGEARATENVTITNCQVSGYDIGGLLDGTRRRGHDSPSDGPIGRIKFGTESNGGFKNITISNCVFDYSRGLALETVDGGLLEDVVISNITMRDIVNAPIFLRLGARLRGPGEVKVGALRRVTLSNITCYNADAKYPSIIAGVPGHDVQDVRMHDIRIYSKGGGTEQMARNKPEEREAGYPEPSMFGPLPAHGLYVRHASGIELRDVEFKLLSPDARAAVVLDDVKSAYFEHVKADDSANGARFDLRNVSGLEIFHSPGLQDMTRKTVTRERL